MMRRCFCKLYQPLHAFASADRITARIEKSVGNPRKSGCGLRPCARE